jgi:hypothetical protein
MVAARKQIISKNETGDDDQDREQTGAEEKHDTHTDPDPKQDETDQTFQADHPEISFLSSYDKEGGN